MGRGDVDSKGVDDVTFTVRSEVPAFAEFGAPGILITVVMVGCGLAPDQFTVS